MLGGSGRGRSRLGWSTGIYLVYISRAHWLLRDRGGAGCACLVRAFQRHLHYISHCCLIGPCHGLCSCIPRFFHSNSTSTDQIHLISTTGLSNLSPLYPHCSCRPAGSRSRGAHSSCIELPSTYAFGGFTPGVFPFISMVTGLWPVLPWKC